MPKLRILLQVGLMVLYTLSCISVQAQIQIIDRYDEIMRDYRQAYNTTSYFDAYLKLQAAKTYTRKLRERINEITTEEKRTFKAALDLVEELDSTQQELKSNLLFIQQLNSANQLALNARAALDANRFRTALELALQAMIQKDTVDLPAIVYAFGDAVYQYFRKEKVCHSYEILGLDVATSGKWLAYSLDSIWLWDAADQLIKAFAPHSGVINGVKFSPNGQYFVSYSQDSTARLWSAFGDSLSMITGMTGRVNAATFSPDSEYLLTGATDSLAILWKLTGERMSAYKGHQGQVLDTRFSADGSRILTRSGDATVKVWKRNGEPLTETINHQAWVHHAEFIPKQSAILTYGADEVVAIWDEMGVRRQSLKTELEMARVARTSSDGAVLAYSFSDKTTVLSDLKTHKKIRLKHPGLAVEKLGFSPSDDLLFIAGGTQVNIWTTDGQLLAVLAEHADEVTAVVFSPNEKQVLTTSKDGTAKLWDLEGNLLMNMPGFDGTVKGGRFSPTGEKLMLFTSQGAVVSCQMPQTIYEQLLEDKDKTLQVSHERCQ